MESDGVSILGLLGLFLIVMFIWKGVRGAIDLIRQYNFIVILLYLVVLTPLAFCHALLRGFTMKSEKELREEAEARKRDLRSLCAELLRKRIVSGGANKAGDSLWIST